MIIHKNKWALGETHNIILEDGAAIVRVSVYNDDPKTAWIFNVSVIEERRGEGLGDKILELAEKEAREMGATTVKLSVEEDLWCKDWYKRKGYVFENYMVEFKGEILLKNLE